MWARINNGAVAEITDIDPAGRFHPSMQWVACSADTRPGWQFDGEQCLPPPAEPLADLATAKRSAIESARLAAEAEGVMINGIRYSGDPGNRQALREAVAVAEDAGMEAFGRWKDSDGRFHDAHPVADVWQALRAIAARRSELIEREGELVAQIDSILADEKLSDDEKRAQIEAVGWSEE